jgi:hypothetical protein
MMPRDLAEGLASAFLGAKSWSARALAAEGAAALGERPEWLRYVVKCVLVVFDDPPRADFEELARVIAGLAIVYDGHHIRRWRAPALSMRARRWLVPALATTGELAAWLDLEPARLEWYADIRGLERCARDRRMQHYTYRWVAKRGGGRRLLEAPKAHTKALQRMILHGILDVVPPHDAAHGFRHGRSIRTHALAHAGRDVVLRMDLADFFLSIPSARVVALFRALGYPSPVALAMGALCTNRAPSEIATIARYTPRSEIDAIRDAERLARTRHLPQGAPTSPAIANLCAYGLDVRLGNAARSAGATYTRYADDLVFSGDATFARRAHRFAALAAAIAIDEGFRPNHRKTRMMHRSGRQVVTGLVVNAHPAIRRADYERYEAILVNCIRHGPASQNRDAHPDFRAHLRGLVAQVASIQPERGRKLAALLERVSWSGE